MTKKSPPDISAALRELLLAKAEGRITADEFARREAELHARLLDASDASAPPQAGRPARMRGSFPRWPIAVAGVVVVAALGLAIWFAKAPAPQPAAGGAMEQAMANAGPSPAEINTQVRQLLEQVSRNPLDAHSWAELGHDYAALGQHDKATDAFAKAGGLLPGDAAVLSDWADSYVMAHDRKWDATSRDLVKKALAADPKYPKALSLAATDAFDSGDYKGAIGYWKRMKEAAPADTSIAKYADDNIAEATAALGGTPMPPAGVATPVAGLAPPAAPASSAAISGRVSIAANLRGKVPPTAVVFVFARNPAGGGPPLAVKRYTVADLPADFRLDDSASMVPGNGISNVSEAVIVARVSPSGSPMPAPGDLESTPQKIRVGTSGVKIEIDQQR